VGCELSSKFKREGEKERKERRVKREKGENFNKEIW